VALLMLGGGLVLHIVARGGEKAAARPAEVAQRGDDHGSPEDDPFLPGNAFLPGGIPEPDPAPYPEEPDLAAAETTTPWSGALVRGGAGFLVGFVVGFALRMLFRVTLVIFGLMLLAMIGASYAGWIHVNWEVVQEQISQWGAAIENEATGVKTFLLGSLPAAGLAGVGLFAGFKKR
jgi:uncharacterized membrane protein (Fun14 family)